MEIYTFVLTKESHTLGNIIASYINDNQLSEFSSYRCPHPLCEDVHVTIKANSSREARHILTSACSALRKEFEHALYQVNKNPPPLTLNAITSAANMFKGNTIRDGDMR